MITIDKHNITGDDMVSNAELVRRSLDGDHRACHATQYERMGRRFMITTPD